MISIRIDRLIKRAKSGARLPLLESWLYNLIAVCPWATHYATLSLSFLICKMRTVTILSLVVVKDT